MTAPQNPRARRWKDVLPQIKQCVYVGMTADFQIIQCNAEEARRGEYPVSANSSLLVADAYRLAIDELKRASKPRAARGAKERVKR